MAGSSGDTGENTGPNPGPNTGGMVASGGGNAGANTLVCGEAAEDQSAQLTCPDGQVIDSVSFASYGTPAGKCGALEEGTCHSDKSVSQVESMCVGRAACTVFASNGSFGDPCQSTTKSLKVEVSCVEGEPTVLPQPYKGLANSPANEIAETAASWCYNWSTEPKASDCGDPLFVPMVWGSGDVAAAIAGIKKAGYDTVLGFNEPNKSDQSNMTVDEAIASWPDLTSEASIRVGSPAVSDDGRAWLEDFMDQVQAKGLRVDFIAMHWYGWNAGSCTAGNLQGAINWASQWGLPVWITEFGCMGSSNPDEATLIKFFNDSIAMLDKNPQVERYAWYPWNTYNDLYLPDENDVRQRTALGDAFAAAPSTR